MGLGKLQFIYSRRDANVRFADCIFCSFKHCLNARRTTSIALCSSLFFGPLGWRGFHASRHAFATDLAASNVPRATLHELMGAGRAAASRTSSMFTPPRLALLEQRNPKMEHEWTGLTLDDSPLFLRDIGSEEVYALELVVP